MLHYKYRLKWLSKMKRSIDGGDVDGLVCYILIYGFSHRVSAATPRLSSAQA